MKYNKFKTKQASEISKKQLLSFLGNYKPEVDNLISVCKSSKTVMASLGDNFNKSTYKEILSNSTQSPITLMYLNTNTKRNLSDDRFKNLILAIDYLLREKIPDTETDDKLTGKLKELDDKIFSSAILNRNVELIKHVHDFVMFPHLLIYDMILQVLFAIDASTNDDFPLHNVRGHHIEIGIGNYSFLGKDMLANLDKVPMLPLQNKAGDYWFEGLLGNMIEFKNFDDLTELYVKISSLLKEYFKTKSPSVEVKLRPLAKELISELRK